MFWLVGREHANVGIALLATGNCHIAPADPDVRDRFVAIAQHYRALAVAERSIADQYWIARRSLHNQRYIANKRAAAGRVRTACADIMRVKKMSKKSNITRCGPLCDLRSSALSPTRFSQKEPAISPI